MLLDYELDTIDVSDNEMCVIIHMKSTLPIKGEYVQSFIVSRINLESYDVLDLGEYQSLDEAHEAIKIYIVNHVW